MSNFSTVSVVVHHKEFKILNITDSELVESVRKHETSSLIRTITNVGHESSTSETTSATTINTLRLSPVLLEIRILKILKTYVHSLKLISLETREGDSSLLHNLNLTHTAPIDLHTK